MSVCSAPNSRYSEHSADQAQSESVSAPLPTAHWPLHCVVAINGETEAASARLYKAFSTFFTPDASRLQSSQSARITRYITLTSGFVSSSQFYNSKHKIHNNAEVYLHCLLSDFICMISASSIVVLWTLTNYFILYESYYIMYEIEHDAKGAQ